MAEAPIPDAKAWMFKSWRDLETARRATTGQPPFYDVAVYHCQQSAEKAVKAFLVHHGKPYEKTHDIEVLVDLACEIDSNFSKLADAADALTPSSSLSSSLRLRLGLRTPLGVSPSTAYRGREAKL